MTSDQSTFIKPILKKRILVELTSDQPILVNSISVGSTLVGLILDKLILEKQTLVTATLEKLILEEPYLMEPTLEEPNTVILECLLGKKETMIVRIQ